MDLFLQKTIDNIRHGKRPSGRTIEKITLDNDIISMFPFTTNLHQICYMLAHNVKQPPKCEHCKTKYASFKSISKGFGKYCSTDCYSSHLSSYNKENNSIKNKARSKKILASKKQILEDAKEYYTNNPVKISDVAEKFNLSYSTLRTFLNKNNVVKYTNQSLFKTENFLAQTDERITDIDFLRKCSEDGLSLKEVGKKLNVCPNTVRLYALKHNIKFHSHSKYEKEILSFIQKYDNTADKSRRIIAPYEIDIYSPKYNFGIEIHGEYWHSEDKVKNTYHLKKQSLAEQNNVKLIQIFSYEWETKEHIIKSMIGSFLGINEKVYARKLTFKEIDKADAKTFFEDNHLQGWLKCQVVFGLVDDFGEIMSAVSFGKPRYDKTCDYELLRFCNKLHTNVVGGFSKLMKNSQRQLNFKSIITYSHRRLFTGEVYRSANFMKVKENRPGYFWYNIKTGKILTRYKTQKHKLNTIKSEIEYMKSLGYRRVFDCGQLIYKYPMYYHRSLVS